MEWLLESALRSFIHRGSLSVETPRGRRLVFGDGIGPPLRVRLHGATAVARLLFDPELAFGEMYAEGTLTVEDGTIADLLRLLLSQTAGGDAPRWARPHLLLRYCRRRLRQFNPRGRARRNVAHHYDLDGRLYSLFLDADRQYSCAYFDSPDLSLDDAQLAKKRHLAAKLLLAPHLTVLDIGCGWGGLGLYLAAMTETTVTGVTLSREQVAAAQRRALDHPGALALSFRLQDYRDIDQRFDRIVSVGMFEHVGLIHYDQFFRRCAALLNDDGIFVLHAIGRSEGPGVTNPWIEKYIFPGGYIPALSEVLPAIERAGLLVADIEILRLHYALTLEAWRQRFLAHREKVERLYDARFARMWEFYLAASEMAFREQNMMVFQIQMTKRQGIVPMTRDYIAARENDLRAREMRAEIPLRLAGE